MTKYQFNKKEFGTHKLILSYLNKNELVLDVGCGSGYLAANSPGNQFYGIEINKNSAKNAEKFYKKTYLSDIEKFDGRLLSRKKFDILIFADILEHLSFPEKTLTYFVDKFLKDNGRVIISLPNIAHLTIRLNLLIGKFDYTESGILDKTHRCFYTLKSAKNLIKKSGLVIEKIDYSSNRLGFWLKKFPILGTLLGFNLIFYCRKK